MSWLLAARGSQPDRDVPETGHVPCQRDMFLRMSFSLVLDQRLHVTRACQNLLET